MKKLMHNITKRLKHTADSAKAVILSKRGDGYIDTAVKAIIGVVVGGLILALLYTLFKDTVFVKLSEAINKLFGYTA